MHMGSELMSIPVASGMLVAAGGGIAYASAKARAQLDERTVPLLGVLGAFVFAAQMVNFPVMPGTSGHFVGATLLAIVVGPHAAALAMSAIVIVQCVVYQDGGLLALGANLFNMAIVGPYCGWAVYRLVTGGAERTTATRLYAGAFFAALASVLAGALLVPLQVTLAGVSRAPLGLFLGWMGIVHALVGTAEGVITFAVLVALRSMRAGVVPTLDDEGSRVPVRTVVGSVLVASLVVGAFVSLAASDHLDGLEATLHRLSVVDEGTANPAAAAADGVVTSLAPLSDYTRGDGGWYWTSVSGVLGVVLLAGVGAAIARAVKNRDRSTGPLAPNAT